MRLAEPRISVVIPTYNRANLLQQTLTSLTNQTISASEYEVIVIDDGSNDETAAIASSFPKVKYTVQENCGPAGARNRGAVLAHAPLILFLDDDVVAEPGLLQAHLMEHKRYDPCSVLGYTPFAPDLPVSPIIDYHRKRWDNIFDEAFRSHDDGGMLPYKLFITINLSVRKTDFERIGPFYTDLSDAAFEDTELGLRFHRAGIPHRFCQAARAVHRPVLTATSLTLRRERFGYLAGRYFLLHQNDDEMRASMLVDYVLGHVPNGATQVRKVKTAMREHILAYRLIATLSFALGNGWFLPVNVRHYFLKLVSLYWYRRGFRQAIRESKLD